MVTIGNDYKADFTMLLTMVELWWNYGRIMVELWWILMVMFHEVDRL